MDIARIKVEFDREIHEKKEDAKRSFVLVDCIQYPRISDFCDRLISLFDLSQVCPHGITLSINGDLLLPCDTSHVLRENDIVHVGMTKVHVIVHNPMEVKPKSYEVAMNILRIKVVFDRKIHERKKDARPSFVLLDHIQHPTISDFCDHLISLFDLSHVCPHGVTLSISGDLLQPWDSSHILRETDIVRVRMTKGHVIVPELKMEHDEIEVKPESYEGDYVRAIKQE